MTSPLIDATTLATIRTLVQAQQTTTVAVWRAPAPSGGKISAPALLHANLPANIYTPATQAQIALLAEMGGGRADCRGEMRYDADVTEGDELHTATKTYIVERAIALDDMTVLALSEVRT